MTRTRLCNTPEPQFGGLGCVGAHTEAMDCEQPECPRKLSKLFADTADI